jgi:nucleoside-triphosphatase
MVWHPRLTPRHSFANMSSMTHLILLAAPRGAGKTTACQRFVAQAREAGLRIGGILAVAHIAPDGRRLGYAVMDAFSEEVRELAVSEPDERRRTVGQFRFDATNLAWALERITTALRAPIDAVVLDEIGPLELVHGGGLAPALDLMSTAQAAVAVLVVRAELLTRLQDRLSALRPTALTLTLANREQTPARLLESVWEHVARPPHDPPQN